MTPSPNPAAKTCERLFMGSAAWSPENNSRSSVFLWTGVVLLLYMLSVGPIVKLALADKIPKDAVETIYAPLVWLGETPLGEKFVKRGHIWYGVPIWRWEVPPK